MPARRLTFTESNIRSAWEAVGIIPFNPRRVLAGETKKRQKVSDPEIQSCSQTLQTPRAVSRATRTAFSLVTRNTPGSQKLRSILTDLSDGLQQTIADKVLEEESHRQYRQLVGKEKKAKTSDRRKLTAATVVTSETVLQLRDQRERIDGEKAARKAKKKPSTASDTTLPLQANTKVESKLTKTASISPPIISTSSPDEVEALWEDLEELEISSSIQSDSGSEYGGPQQGRVRRRGKNIQKVSDILQRDKNVGLEAAGVMSTGLEGMESVDNGVGRLRRGLRF